MLFLIPVIIEVSLCVCVRVSVCMCVCVCARVHMQMYYCSFGFMLEPYQIPCVARGAWGAGEGGCLFRHRVMTTASPVSPPILVVMPVCQAPKRGLSPWAGCWRMKPGTALPTSSLM